MSHITYHYDITSPNYPHCIQFGGFDWKLANRVRQWCIETVEYVDWLESYTDPYKLNFRYEKDAALVLLTHT